LPLLRPLPTGVRARCQEIAIQAFMIALAADAPRAIIECRERARVSAVQRRIRSRWARSARMIARSPHPIKREGNETVQYNAAWSSDRGHRRPRDRSGTRPAADSVL